MMRVFLAELLRYLQAAPFPHLTSLKVSSLAVAAGVEARDLLESAEISTALWLWLGLTCLLVWGVLLCQADAFSRYREFKRLRAMLRRYGFRPRLFKVLAASRCQRDAALLAARETGYRAQAQGLFYQWGYRWYHILPDMIVENPLRFFTPRFVRGTFIPGKTARDVRAAKPGASGAGAPRSGNLDQEDWHESR